MITKHFILTVNPDAKYDWDKLKLRDPLNFEQPDFAEMLGENQAPGHYLIEVHLHVKPLSHHPLNEE